VGQRFDERGSPVGELVPIFPWRQGQPVQPPPTPRPPCTRQRRSPSCRPAVILWTDKSLSSWSWSWLVAWEQISQHKKQFPVVAYNNNTDTYLVAWEFDFNGRLSRFHTTATTTTYPLTWWNSHINTLITHTHAHTHHTAPHNRQRRGLGRGGASCEWRGRAPRPRRLLPGLVVRPRGLPAPGLLPQGQQLRYPHKARARLRIVEIPFNNNNNNNNVIVSAGARGGRPHGHARH